jgi:hypothetical protein
MMSKPLMLAFAGQGDTAFTNIEELLNDLLGYGPEDDEGYYEGTKDDDTEAFFVFPSDVLGDGLDKVIDWSAKAGLDLCVLHTSGDEDALSSVLNDADKVADSTDIVALTLEFLRKAEAKGFDPHLVLLYGDGDQDSESLLRAVTEDTEYPILDLTAGLDEINWVPDEGDEPDPEPEPEPEEKPKRSRAKKVEPLDEGDEPLDDEPHQITVDEAVAEAEAETPDLPHDRGSVTTTIEVDDLDEGDPVKVALVLTEENVRRIVREEIDAAFYVLGARIAQFAAAGNLPEESTGEAEATEQPQVGTTEAPGQSEGVSEAPKRRSRGGRPRKDGSPAVPADEQKHAFVRDEDGALTKRGRGKPRKGTEVVELTLAEAREQGWEG